jgi:hypothetical protein
MPHANRSQTVYVSTGNPDTVNDSTPYFPGQLGQAFDANDRAYQYVQSDSAPSVSGPSGAYAANQVLYWKDRSQYLVTNDSAQGLRGGQANSFRNNVAGILRNACTPGNYIFVLQRGRNINVKEAGAATGGMLLVSDTSATAAQALGTAIATAPPVQNLGVVSSATGVAPNAANVCTADIDIPNIP